MREPGKVKKSLDLFDFGYALTVHKAQGSEAPEVLLFEERSRHMNDDEWRRWLYTGITRAQERLTIVGM
jgi:exodeoxyribonuclease-5